MKEENNVSRNYYATVVWYWREQKSCPFSTLFTVTRALMKIRSFTNLPHRITMFHEITTNGIYAENRRRTPPLFTLARVCMTWWYKRKNINRPPLQYITYVYVRKARLFKFPRNQEVKLHKMKITLMPLPSPHTCWNYTKKS